MKPEVLVVGAGITGLGTAIELARRGVRLTIIEQHRESSASASSVNITPESLSLLEACGATQELLASGRQLNNLNIYTNGELKLNLPFSQTQKMSPYRFALSTSQQHIKRILTRTLGKFGVDVKYNQQLTSLLDNHDSVVATCSDGSAKAYRYVIGADGKHSTTCDLAGLRHSGYSLKENWSFAEIATDDWQSPHAFTLLLNKGAMAAVAPIENNRIKVITNSSNPIDLLPAYLKVLLVHHQESFSVSVQQASTYQRGNIFLAGDAAHCHAPVTGHGVNLGIADAAMLAQCISNGDVTSYSAVRHPAGAQRIAASERTRKLLSSKNPLMCAAVNRSLSLCAKTPRMQHHLIDQILV